MIAPDTTPFSLVQMHSPGARHDSPLFGEQAGASRTQPGSLNFPVLKSNSTYMSFITTLSLPLQDRGEA